MTEHMNDTEAQEMACWATVAMDPETHLPRLLSDEEIRDVYEAGFDLNLERMWVMPGPLEPETSP